VDSALEEKEMEDGARLLMQMDRLRYRVAAGDSLGAGKEWKRLSRVGGESLSADASALKAWLDQKGSRFSVSAEEWKRAASLYRKQGQWASAGECLIQESLSLMAAGNPQEADAAAQKASGVFQELGLPASAARAEALHILIREGENMLAKTLRDSELPFHAENQTDWNALLEKVAQDLSNRTPSSDVHGDSAPLSPSR
jgi:hypothetical protein